MLEARLQNNIEVIDGCWHWLGKPTMYGYGQIKYTGKYWRAHRLIYTILVGKIPSGLHLDHLCKNKMCVNPKHLEPVTNKENVLRGDGVTAVNSRKVECHRGHGLSGENLYITPSGNRNCKSCRIIYQKRWRDRVRQTPQIES